MARLLWLLVALLVLPSLAASTARAVIFTVDSTGVAPDLDLGDGVCDDGSRPGPACTLRAAIDQANASPGSDEIEFAIPGAGPHTIPDHDLFVTDAVTIDATMQAGASKNTLAAGTNAVLPVVLEADFGTGSAVGVYAFARVELRGLAFRGAGGGIGNCVRFDSASAGSRLVGSRVERCGFEAILVQADNVRIGGWLPADRNLISDNAIGVTLRGSGGFVANNLIGTDPTGTVRIPNLTGIAIAGTQNSVADNWIDAVSAGVSIEVAAAANTLARNRIRGDGTENGFGVHVSAGAANLIGLPSATLAHANRISGFGAGVLLSDGASGNLVQGNLIGVEANGTPSAANGYGVLLRDASGNTIGEPLIGSSGAGNWIAFNRRGLILGHPSFDPSLGNSLRGNRVWAQTELNTDHLEDGSLNDDDGSFPPDQDEGPNRLQNPPRIEAVTQAEGETRIEGQIAAQSGIYTLDFYSNSNCSPTPFGGRPGGQFHLGKDSLSASPTPADPLTSFDVTLTVTALGNGFSAMATDANGNSSEFSACFLSSAALADLAVEVTADASSVDAGEPVTFTVTLTNQGPLEATDVVVQAARPAGFSAFTADPPGSYDETAGEWLVGDLGSGEVATLVLTGTVAVDPPASIPMAVEAAQGFAQLDPDLLNNQDSVQVEVRIGADLQLSQVAPSLALPGALVGFDVEVTNVGPADALGVTLAGELGAGLIFEAASDPDLEFNSTTRRWELSVGDLADGSADGVRVEARIADAAAPGAGLRHIVSAFAASPLDPSLELETAVVAVGPAADLVLVSIQRLGNVQLGRFLRVTIRNDGPDPVDAFTLVVNGSFSFVPAATCAPFNLVNEACVFPEALGTHEQIEIDITPFPDSLSADVGSADAAPYYELDEPDNHLSWVTDLDTEGCGLTGIEAVFGFGLLMLMRRWLSRRARGRILSAAALLLAVSGALPDTAQAVPIVFNVDSAASSASVALASPLGSPLPAPVALSGSASADVALAVDASFGLVATSLQLIGAALAFSDATILLSSPPLFDLSFAGSELGASLSGPSASGFPVGPGLSLFDLGGSALVLDAGTVAATGTYFGSPVDVTLDLAATPFTSIFPINSVAQLQVVDLGGGNASLRLSFPFSAPLRLTVDDIESTVTIAGTLVLDGTAVVPEPATALLLGGGLVCLAARRRRAAARRD